MSSFSRDRVSNVSTKRMVESAVVRPAFQHRNVAVLAASLFGLALGEELWQAYVPAYLTALGATGIAVGLFGSSKDLLDSLYQFPGGWLSDRLGRRRTLLAFTALAIAGYAVYATASSWPFVFVGLIGVMAWKAGAFPTTFAVIGDSLPPGRRSVAFAVQSILVRVPRVVSAPIGGLLIAGFGIVNGIRLSVAITIALGCGVLALQSYAFRDAAQSDERRTSPSLKEAFAAMPAPLRRLLAADSLVRIGEGIAASFIVLYVTGPLGYSAADYGLLYAVQQLVSIACYLPGGRLADASGRAPVITATFVFFALFPILVGFATTYSLLVTAFVIGGFKEIGEPARKSLIVDLAPDRVRASTVGVYYTIRNLVVVPAGLVGGLLWQKGSILPLEAAFAVSMAGTVVFLLMQRTQRVP